MLNRIKNTVLLLVSFSFSILSNAQIQSSTLGYYYDISGKPIEGVAGPKYQPEKVLTKVFTVGDKFTPGHYYDAKGEKHTGKIRFKTANTNFRFHYLDETEYQAKTIRPNKCNAYVIGVDSFITRKNFNIERTLGSFNQSYQDYIQVLDVVGNLTFLRHEHTNSNRILYTYIVQEADHPLVSFKKGGKKLKDSALHYFGDVPIIKKNIDNSIRSNDCLNLFSIYKYYYKYINNEKLYLGRHLTELESKDNAFYYLVPDLSDSTTIKLSYFHLDGTPIFTGQYSSIIPLVKKGLFTWYHPDGTVWKQERFNDSSEFVSEITYYLNGKLHSVRENLFQKSDTSDYLSPRKWIDTYTQLYATNTESLLDEKGYGTEVFYDAFLERTIYKEYGLGVLNSAYYIDDTQEKIYQFCDRISRIKNHRNLERSFSSLYPYPEMALKENREWTCLVKFIVETTGVYSSYEIVSEPNLEFDTQIKLFFDGKKSVKLFSKARHNGKKVKQEIVLPFCFVIHNFSRHRNPNYIMFIPSLELLQPMQIPSAVFKY